MQQSGLSLLLFCVPLYNVLSFLVHCCLIVWNQHCLGSKIFCTYSRFPEANVSERQISRIVRTIRDTRFVRVYTQDSLSRTISEVNTSFFHGPHLRVSRFFCPTDTPCRETRQHALALTLKIRKLGEELSSDLFIGTNSRTKVVV